MSNGFTPDMFKLLAEESDTGIIVRDAETYELYYTNRAVRKILGSDFVHHIGNTCHGFLHGNSTPCKFCNQNNFCREKLSLTEQYISDRDVYVSIKGLIVDWNDREAVVEYIDDITDKSKAKAQTDELIKNIDCGLMICSITADGICKIQYINDGYLALCEMPKQPLSKRYDFDNYDVIFPDDRDNVKKMFTDLAQRRFDSELSYRVMTADGGLRWLYVRNRVVNHPDGASTVYMTYTDLTEQMSLQNQLGDIINTVPCGMALFTWDGKEITPVLVNKQQLDMLGETLLSYLDTGPQIDYKHVHPDDIEGLRRESVRALTVTGELDYTYRSLNISTGEYIWLRTRGRTVAQPDGKTLIYISYFDVTKEHNTEERLRESQRELTAKYELERRRPSLGEDDLLVHALFNLTTGETLEYFYSDGSEVPMSDRTALNVSSDSIDELIIDDDKKLAYSALNNRTRLLERFSNGENEIKLDYRRRMRNGEILWVRNVMHIVRDPSSDDILLFDYFYDIDEEALETAAYRSLAADNYDFVMRVDCKKNSYSLLPRQTRAENLPPVFGDDFDTMAATQINGFVHPDDRPALSAAISISAIRAKLLDNDRYTLTFREFESNGMIKYRKLTLYYLERERELVIITREDVSKLVQAEMEKNGQLASALEAANQASRAKTAFLSRMSHELRTPMNAIIGLATLAENDVDKPDMMRDTMEKITMSSHYLLSLINDILEMSRIESGKLTLHETPFDFRQLLSSVSAIIYEQANARGVDYDIVVNGYTDDTYIGDSTKLQQILVNILGNSVKFTNDGGKIKLTVEQLKRTDKTATLKFIISDNGIGINREFLPHIFDAFSQESAALTSTSSGTGLGLAITKSLVEMMNGQIMVESIKGVGSVFTIDISLGVTEKSRRYTDVLKALKLSKLHALIVDDDVTVCRSTEQLLESMSIKAEWVDSGLKAVERVRATHGDGHDFDTIFVDWRMPEIDGIETARRIREIVGQSVTVVIMTAYDWRTIEEKAKAVGVDMFVEKPLLQSSVFEAYEKIYANKPEIKAEETTEQYDFSGKRVLLADDQPLNVEVATRILEHVGITVTVATTGLEALEMFTTSEDGYFDAILMDIRMPVMDGLTASKSIRNLKKAGSREIPIIAMTANAFDEDVELSLQNGMDAHLAKPIEPKVLYRTLKGLLKI